MHWPRDPQRREDAHRYRHGDGVQIIATLGSLAMNTPGLIKSLVKSPIPA